jgi:hypothetical protein
MELKKIGNNLTKVIRFGQLLKIRRRLKIIESLQSIF